MKTYFLIPALVLSVFAGACCAGQHGGVVVHKDLEYAKSDGKSLRLDLYLPKDTLKKVPLIVMIHGGGWYRGDKAIYMKQAELFANSGYAAASINYRFIPEYIFPAGLKDCIAAVKWLKDSSAVYGIDPERVGVFGDSSGGHLALMTALAGENAGFGSTGGTQAAAVWFPVTDIPLYFSKNPKLNEKLMGGSLEKMPEEYKKASPVNYVSKNNPPTLLIHGERDRVVPIKHSEDLFSLMKTAGAKVELLRVKNADHAFVPPAKGFEPDYDGIMKKMVKFFDEHLK